MRSAVGYSWNCDTGFVSERRDLAARPRYVYSGVPDSERDLVCGMDQRLAEERTYRVCHVTGTVTEVVQVVVEV